MRYRCVFWSHAATGIWTTFLGPGSFIRAIAIAQVRSSSTRTRPTAVRDATSAGPAYLTHVLFHQGWLALAVSLFFLAACLVLRTTSFLHIALPGVFQT